MTRSPINGQPPPPEEQQACVCPDAGMPPTWMPGHLSAIVCALEEEGLWPCGVVPLCVEYRCICPALLALSDHQAVERDSKSTGAFGFARAICGVGCTAKGCRSGAAAVDLDKGEEFATGLHGFLCGSYLESATTREQRSLLGSFTGVVHAAASSSWLRLQHARNPAALSSVQYDALDPEVGRGGGAERLVQAQAYVSETDVGVASSPAPDAPSAAVRSLCIAARHPGRDRYLGGWCTAQTAESNSNRIAAVVRCIRYSKW